MKELLFSETAALTVDLPCVKHVRPSVVSAACCPHCTPPPGHHGTLSHVPTLLLPPPLYASSPPIAACHTPPPLRRVQARTNECVRGGGVGAGDRMSDHLLWVRARVWVPLHTGCACALVSVRVRVR